MKKRQLGDTGIEVSQIGIGTLPMGPLQAGIDPKVGGKVIARALEKGINFIDGAKAYRTYEHIREGIEGHKAEAVIAQKSPSKTAAEMEQDVGEALRAMGRDYIDIYDLHAARDERPFEEFAPAIEALIKQKEKGKIRAIGIATHCCKAVDAAAAEPAIDVIHPLINFRGMGILNGGKEEMLAAIKKAVSAGKGIYAMKAFAGGCLLQEYEEAMNFILDNPDLHTAALGMTKEKEVDDNVHFCEHRALREPLEIKEKRLIILTGLCNGDGACVENCPQSALMVKDGKAVVNVEKCILCGYCVPHCPQFCIRMA